MIRSLLVLALAAPLLAQAATAEEPRGPFAAIPHGLSLGAEPGAATVLVKPTGDTTTPPQVPVQPVLGPPDFAASALFGFEQGLFDLDAMSTGNDLIPVDAMGNIDPAQNGGWVALTFSVTADTTDEPGTIIDLRSQLPGGAGADLFGYFLLDSNTDPGTLGVPAELVGRTFLQQGTEHSGITSTEMDGHDAFLPFVASGSVPPAIGFLQRQDRFYFSVTSASAADLNVARETNSTLQQWFVNPVSAADVYVMTWSTASCNWSMPAVAWSAGTLGLSSEEDLDALAVDAPPQGAAVVLFSTKTPSRPTLLLSIGGAAGVVARTPIGPIRLVNSGDVDAICSYDPESGEGFNPYLGFPCAVAGLAPKIGLSVAGDGRVEYRVIVSGWERQALPGTMSLYAFVAGSRWTLVDNQPRSSIQHSMGFAFTLPAAPTGGEPVDLLAVFAPQGNLPHQPSWMVRLLWPVRQ